MSVNYWILALVFTIFGTACAVCLIVYLFQERDKRSELLSAFLIAMCAILTLSGLSQTVHHLGKILH